MRRVLARRDMRLYVIAQTLSMFGDTALWLALAVWAKTLTGSSAAAGMVIFGITLAWALTYLKCSSMGWLENPTFPTMRNPCANQA